MSENKNTEEQRDGVAAYSDFYEAIQGVLPIAMAKWQGGLRDKLKESGAAEVSPAQIEEANRRIDYLHYETERYLGDRNFWQQFDDPEKTQLKEKYACPNELASFLDVVDYGAGDAEPPVYDMLSLFQADARTSFLTSNTQRTEEDVSRLAHEFSQRADIRGLIPIAGEELSSSAMGAYETGIAKLAAHFMARQASLLEDMRQGGFGDDLKAADYMHEAIMIHLNIAQNLGEGMSAQQAVRKVIGYSRDMGWKGPRVRGGAEGSGTDLLREMYEQTRDSVRQRVEAGGQPHLER